MVPAMAEQTQLDRIEDLLRTIKLQNTQQTGLLTALVAGGQLTMSQLTDLSAAVDNVTNQLAASFDAISIKLDAEGTEITQTAARVQQVIDQLRNSGAPQEVLDTLAGVVTKLGGTASAIDASTTKIDQHVTQLQGIPATMPTT
jgi:hypothetical protein